MNLEEKVIATQPIFDGNVVKLRVDDIELPDGTITKRELIAHNGGVAVLALTDDNKIPMVTQYRTGAKCVTLELPAGKLEVGEEPIECGKRELIEETGYEGSEFEYLGSFYPTPAYCEEKIHLYLAKGLKWVGQNLDEGEFLNVTMHTLEELTQKIMNNEINDGKTIIAILKAKELLNK